MPHVPLVTMPNPRTCTWCGPRLSPSRVSRTASSNFSVPGPWVLVRWLHVKSSISQPPQKTHTFLFLFCSVRPCKTFTHTESQQETQQRNCSPVMVCTCPPSMVTKGPGTWPSCMVTKGHDVHLVLLHGNQGVWWVSGHPAW